ncbi:hypothetical protein EW14_1513 [Prochlorococcus sp. MIT 0604]|nr:hypothetical protein EW14_1513 [Prochlorococcus sp. MIT 0604]
MKGLKYIPKLTIPFLLAFIKFSVNVNIPAIDYLRGSSIFAISAIFSAFLGFFGEGFKDYFNNNNIDKIYKIIYIYYLVSLTFFLSIFFRNSLFNIVSFFTISGGLSLLERVIYLNLGYTNSSYINNQLYTLQLSLRYFSIIFIDNQFLVIILSIANLICITYQIRSLYLSLIKEKIISEKLNFRNLFSNFNIKSQNRFLIFPKFLVYPSILYLFSKYVEYADKIYCSIGVCSTQTTEYVRLFGILITIFFISSEYLNLSFRTGKSLKNNNIEIKSITNASIVISTFALIFLYFKLGADFGLYTYLILASIAFINAISNLRFIYSFTNYKNDRKNLLLFGFLGFVFSIPILFSKFPFIAPMTVIITANIGLFIKNKFKFLKVKKNIR